jgi:5-formyltetrahydrofolate cyclo-ligase
LPKLAGEKLKFVKMGKFFRKNRFGIEEPIFSPLLGAHRMDVILMPLVGFDKHKNRLGMGGGFYDKTLSFHNKLKKFRVPKLFGLAFDSQEVDRLNSQPWDVKVDGIVTPSRFIK